MYDFQPLSPLAQSLINSLEAKQHVPEEENRLAVNPIVSKFASAYEKIRNAMEIREEEVILRATIERILKRRLLLGGTGGTTAEPLVKELLWARYIPNHEIGKSMVHKVQESIDLYLSLRLQVLEKHRVPEAIINDWIYDLMSADIQYLLNPKREKEIIANFMFHILRDDVVIEHEAEQTRDAQVFIAVRKAFAKDDLAFLRYHIFSQYFGRLSKENLDYTVENFLTGYKEILNQFNYIGKEKIYAYVKRRTAAFFILEDILLSHQGNLKSILENKDELEKTVFEACETRYKGVSQRVRRAVVRSVIFILLTKFAFAFFVEGTYDKIFFGHILWTSLIINTSIPPMLMVFVSFFMRAPGEKNSKRVLSYITALLHNENPNLGNRLIVEKKIKESKFTLFNILWWCAFVISFGGMVLILQALDFTIISIFIFVFFLAIVSFLAYRIGLIANTYRVGDNQGILTPLIDFLFMPVIRTGRRLTQSIAQVNIFLFIFDFFIEAPFKSTFAFFDQWFYYLHSKSEELE